MNTNQQYGQIQSDSMVPIIKVGDVIYISPVELQHLKPFDIIVFKDTSALINGAPKLICHIYLNIDDNNQITTCSYNNFSLDENFSSNNILGKVTNYKVNIFQKLKIFINLLLIRRKNQ